jgi:hypothetical protein
MAESPQWTGIRERVAAVYSGPKRAYGPFPLFEPVLSESEIAEVEAQYGVTLPEDYRAFLAEVGSGGAGPTHELTTLRRVDGRWGWVWDHDEAHAWRLDPAAPFTESPDWPAHQAATLRAAGREPTTRDEEDDYLADYCEVFGEEFWYLDRGRGAIHISDNGCAMTSWLVVVGPHRGEVRHRDDGPNPEFRPLVDADGRPHTFRSWYLAWLERLEDEER